MAEFLCSDSSASLVGDAGYCWTQLLVLLQDAKAIRPDQQLLRILPDSVACLARGMSDAAGPNTDHQHKPRARKIASAGRDITQDGSSDPGDADDSRNRCSQDSDASESGRATRTVEQPSTPVSDASGANRNR